MREQKPIYAIACINSNNLGIGYNNKLLYHFNEDMDFFKMKTIGNTIVYGNSTLKSFPRCEPLIKRNNIVITHDISNISKKTIDFCDVVIYFTEKETKLIKGSIKEYTGEITNKVLYVANSVKIALKVAYILGKDTYICGGESIYNQTIDYCDEVYLTVVEAPSIEADAYFPYIVQNEKCWNKYFSGKSFIDEHNIIRFKFEYYKNLNKKSIFDQ